MEKLKNMPTWAKVVTIALVFGVTGVATYYIVKLVKKKKAQKPKLDSSRSQSGRLDRPDPSAPLVKAPTKLPYIFGRKEPQLATGVSPTRPVGANQCGEVRRLKREFRLKFVKCDGIWFQSPVDDFKWTPMFGSKLESRLNREYPNG